MVFKNSVFFIVSKSYLIANLMIFREKRLHIFPNTFIVIDPSWIKTFEIFFPLFFQKQSPGMFCKIGVLKYFAKFTGKHRCQSLFFNKVAGLRPENLLKKRLWHRCFPVNFMKSLRTPFFREYLWWLLLNKLCYSCTAFDTPWLYTIAEKFIFNVSVL